MVNETKSLRLARWLDRLSMYDCEIVYREGAKNGNADALSRIATEEITADIENREENNNIIVNQVNTEVNSVRFDVNRMDERQLEDHNIKWVYDNLK
jgi:hypothetical protein